MPDPHRDGKPANEAEDLTGLTVGRFVVRSVLGVGGMGQVYGAEDPTLKRFVALKRMAPREQATAADRERLLREAQRASALNHPNIAAMYDVVEHKGELWLVMEYVEGETLGQRMKQPLSREEFYAIATQCCEALQAAHERQIIHGDIKPENIMLTPGGRVKILDFGVARRHWQGDACDAAQTMDDVLVTTSGTPAYTAPEVLLQRPDDGRSDLFSLGLVMYEMLGGDHPFQSDSLATTAAKVVHEEPKPLTNVPAPLAQIVTRLLAKNPDERYPTAAALLADLRTVERGGMLQVVPTAGGKRRSGRTWMLVGAVLALLVLAAVFAGRTSIRRRVTAGSTSHAEVPATKILAVLPFSAASGDTKFAALGQGLVDSVARKLENLTEDRPLEVISARSLQDKGVSTPQEAARQFGANLALKIELEPAGDLTRVSYSVLTPTGQAVQQDSVTVPATDAFAVEQNVAEGVVQALRLQLKPDEQLALKYQGTDHPDAYKYYLQARGYLMDYSKEENVENSTLMAREALKLDPNFGMAKAVLGESYWRRYSNTKQASFLGQAKEECKSAVSAGNSGSAGHVCLGWVNDGTGHTKEAIAEFQLALGLEPTNEDAAIGLAMAYEHDGRNADAERAYEQAIQLHPNSRFALNAAGTFYLRRKEYDRALQNLQKVVQLAPDNYATYVNLGATYNEMGQFENALEPLRKSIAIRPSYAAYVNLGTSYFGLTRYADAANSYEEATKLDPAAYVTWGNLGEARYYAGQKQESEGPYRKAVELAQQELKVNPTDADVCSSLASYYSMLGDRKQSLAYLSKALQYGRHDKSILLDAASVYNRLGQPGLALEWLARLVQAGYPTASLRSQHEFDNLASLPAYQQLMKSGK